MSLLSVCQMCSDGHENPRYSILVILFLSFLWKYCKLSSIFNWFCNFENQYVIYILHTDAGPVLDPSYMLPYILIYGIIQFGSKTVLHCVNNSQLPLIIVINEVTTQILWFLAQPSRRLNWAFLIKICPLSVVVVVVVVVNLAQIIL